MAAGLFPASNRDVFKRKGELIHQASEIRLITRVRIVQERTHLIAYGVHAECV